MNWNQPVCARCFAERNPGREPVRVTERYREPVTCAFCGQPNRDGIYVRIDPQKVPYPAPENDD